MTTAQPIVGRYACPVCPKRYIELAEKKAHMKSAHPKPVRG